MAQIMNPFAVFYQGNTIKIDHNGMTQLFDPNSDLSLFINNSDGSTEPMATDEVFGFWFPGKNADVDKIYEMPILGNFYDVPIQIQIQIYNRKFKFRNVEALFHAFKLLYIDFMNRNNYLLIQGFDSYQDMTG